MNDIHDQLVHVAQAIIDEKIDLILGCREIDRLRSRLDEQESPLFFPFRAIASETDHVPFGDVRKHWNEQRLQQLDQETLAYVSEIRDAVVEDCRAIIHAYGRYI